MTVHTESTSPVELVIPPFVVAGVRFTHNTSKWRVATNRHPEISGRAWGWIEGAPGNVCWSNNHTSGLNETAASEAVRIHNDWLEAQKPLSIRIVEARDKCATSKAAYVAALANSEKAENEYGAAERALHELLTEALSDEKDVQR